MPRSSLFKELLRKVMSKPQIPITAQTRMDYWAKRNQCKRFFEQSGACHKRMQLSSLQANQELEKNLSLRHCISTVSAVTSLLSPSIPHQFLKSYLNQNCSDTSEVHSLGLKRLAKVALNKRQVALYFSMRSAICLPNFKQGFFAFYLTDTTIALVVMIRSKQA